MSVSRSQGINVAFAVLAFSAIFLQKIGFTPTSDITSSVGLDDFILCGVLLWLLARGSAMIDPSRSVLFLALVCSVTLSLYLAGGYGSLPAVIVFLGMYGTMVFQVDVDRAILLMCVNKFQSCMYWIAWIIIGQQIIQYTIGNNYWPNLNNLIPSPLLIGGYAYWRPYSWKSPYFVPNGVFFLEPSIASGYLAIALAAEILWFSRLKRIALFGVALLVGMAATGPVVIALFSVPLLFKMERRLRGWVVGFGVPLLLVAALSGVFSHYTDRSREFSQTNSSAHGRLVVPFDQSLNIATDPSYVITGNGPGSSVKGDNQVQWPVNKLIFEYGLLTAILFHIFLLFVVLRDSPSILLGMILLIPHLFFGGGFVTHTNIMLLVMFGTLLRVRDVHESVKSGNHRRYEAVTLNLAGNLYGRFDHHRHPKSVRPT